MLGTDRSTWRRSTVDTYVVAGIADHLCPWQTCYRTTQLLGGDTGSCCPPAATSPRWSTRRATRRPASRPREQQPGRPEEWLDRARRCKGSWWHGLHGLARRAQRRGAHQAAPRSARPPTSRCATPRAPMSMTAEHASHGRATVRGRVRPSPRGSRSARAAGAYAGEPPLLLCNGIGASLEALQPFVDALDPDRGVVRFDVPGVGGSPLPPLPYPIAALSSWTVALMAQLGHQRFDVLGLSWGGGLAQQLAVQSPRRVRRVVLVATGTGCADGAGPPAGAGPDADAAAAPRPGLRRAASPARSTAARCAPTPGAGRDLLHAATRVGPEARLLLPAGGDDRLDQPAVPAPDPAADAGDGRRRRPDHPGGQRRGCRRA